MKKPMPPAGGMGYQRGGLGEAYFSTKAFSTT